MAFNSTNNQAPVKKTELSDEELAKLKDAARDAFSFARQNILRVHPFIGSIALQLNIIPVRDRRLDTACTDGKNIYIDIAFYAGLNQDEREFIMAHEIWHNVLLHCVRHKGMQPTILNVAQDMVVNQIIDKDGFIGPKGLCWPNRNKGHESEFNFPDDLSTEEYYALLMKELQKHQQNGGGAGGQGGQGGGQGQQNQQGNGQGNGQGKLQGQFDKHVDPTANQQKPGDEGDDEQYDKYGKRGYDKDYNPGYSLSESEMQSMTNEMREKVLSAVHQIERTRGTLPAYIKGLVQEMTTSKMPWKDYLASFVTKTIANKPTWNRPNRRFAYNGLYLPSHTGEALRLIIGVDTSGSCCQDFPKFLGEIVGIAQTFGSYELHVIQCDTEVKDYRKFSDEEEEINEDIASEFEFKGCGGTTLSPVFDYIEENQDVIEADAMVFLTDGECEDITTDKDPGIPVLWVLTGTDEPERFRNLHFGEKIALIADED